MSSRIGFVRNFSHSNFELFGFKVARVGVLVGFVATFNGFYLNTFETKELQEYPGCFQRNGQPI
jgi:hypothetical protein